MSSAEFYDRLPFGVLVVEEGKSDPRVLFASRRMEELCGGRIAPGTPVSEVVPAVGKGGAAPIPLGSFWVKLWESRGEWETRPARILFAGDVSKEQEHREELQEAVAGAEALARMKSGFLATMSHEMRTPLQSVYGLLELMEFESLSPPALDMVRRAKNAASGLLEILDDVLDLAKIEAERMELDRFEVPLRTLVLGVVEALSVRTAGRDLTLESKVEEGVPAVVIGDPKRLRQILMNLVGNALKFTEKGSVLLRVCAIPAPTKDRKERPLLRFEVVDTGPGLSEPAQEGLFQVFARADNSASRKAGGTGLGLSICKKLVELMGGRIGVLSAEGKGSTFWFEIPAEEVKGERAEAGEIPDLRGISVLSVESHPLAAREIAGSLSSMGADVESCKSVQEAREITQNRPFDVGVIEQNLPDGNGIDLVRHLTEARPGIGLVMYTARNDAGLQHSLSSLGVPYLGKPASRLGLGRAVAEAASRGQFLSPKRGERREGRILIAEDTPGVQDLLRRQMEVFGLGNRTDMVEGGRAALEMLERSPYGILVTDLHMPDMDGYALVKAVREREKKTGDHLPVIVLTADVQMAERSVYIGHGFDECLLKPVSLGHFKRLLIRWGVLDPDSASASAFLPDSGMCSGTAVAAIDKEFLIAQMGELDDTALEILGRFGQMTRPILEGIEKGMREKKSETVKELAHSLKGGARSAGALILGDMAARIQEAAEQGRVPAESEIEDLNRELTRVCAAIADMAG